MIIALQVLVYVVFGFVWFRIGWLLRARRLALQIQQLDALEDALKREIERCRAIVDASTTSTHYGTLRKKQDPGGYIH